MQGLDGVILVMYGVLGAYWLSYVRYDSLLAPGLWCFLIRNAFVCIFYLNQPWSTLFDNVQGEALFQTHENLEHLAMMERVLGPLPQHMLKKSEWVLFVIPLVISGAVSFQGPNLFALFNLAVMLKNMLEGVDLTGLREQPPVIVLKLFLSCLGFRFVYYLEFSKLLSLRIILVVE